MKKNGLCNMVALLSGAVLFSVASVPGQVAQAEEITAASRAVTAYSEDYTMGSVSAL